MIPLPTIPRVEVVLYTRPDCCLCEEAMEILRKARTRRHFDLFQRNVEESEELRTLYGQEIPVITVNGRKAFKFHVDPYKLERVLEHAEQELRR